jgi:hypothetical protein|uniref:Uncharacterized protein n=1 Tax=Populus trichocarpa TaxID=3694 RepID=A0A3N7G1P5_POPTR
MYLLSLIYNHLDLRNFLWIIATISSGKFACSVFPNLTGLVIYVIYFLQVLENAE